MNPEEKPYHSYDGYLFNSAEYITIQPKTEYYTFKLLEKSSGYCVASLLLFIDGDRAVSPSRAPFGSIEYSQDLCEADLQILIEAVNNFMEANKIKKCLIKSYPEAYSQKRQILKNLFLKNGFQIVKTESNFHLPITSIEFEERLHLSERRRLRKSEEAGFKFNLLRRVDAEEIFDFIISCRESRQYSMTISREEFRKIFQSLSPHYLVFTLTNAGKIIALTIGVRVNKNILYNFLPCNDIAYMNYSPMVLLLKGIYNYCRNNEYKIFDLGPATGEDSLPARGLVNFKKNVGGLVSEKFTFRKEQ